MESGQSLTQIGIPQSNSLANLLSESANNRFLTDLLYTKSNFQSAHSKF